MKQPPKTFSRIAPHKLALAAMLYVAVVFTVDALAMHYVKTPFRWAVFEWKSGYWDWFKFTAWFIVPCILMLPRMDWGAWGLARWRRIDYTLLAVVIVLGAIAMFIIPMIPSLKAIYGGLGDHPLIFKRQWAMNQLIWTLSWLIGWEFMHRCFLLRTTTAAWPRFGWLLVPLSETLYHLQKPPIEAAGMALLGIALTLWTLKRKNILFPICAHLIIEIELILFRVFT